MNIFVIVRVCSLLILPFKSFLKFSFALFPPVAPFLDGFCSNFRRTRRLKVDSDVGCVAQTHFGEKPGFQIFARKQVDQFRNGVSRHSASLFGKFTSFHYNYRAFRYLVRISPSAYGPSPSESYCGESNLTQNDNSFPFKVFTSLK